MISKPERDGISASVIGLERRFNMIVIYRLIFPAALLPSSSFLGFCKKTKWRRHRQWQRQRAERGAGLNDSGDAWFFPGSPSRSPLSLHSSASDAPRNSILLAISPSFFVLNISHSCRQNCRQRMAGTGRGSGKDGRIIAAKCCSEGSGGIYGGDEDDVVGGGGVGDDGRERADTSSNMGNICFFHCCCCRRWYSTACTECACEIRDEAR